MKHLHTRWKVLIAFATGAVGMLLLNTFTPVSINASISEEILNIRSEGVIQTQQKEIERLRAMVQKLGRQSGISVSEQELKGSSTCTTHNDCPSIASVCVQNTCQTLQDPLCECGLDNKYVICISQNGEGNEARTVSCGDGMCAADGTPRCV